MSLSSECLPTRIMLLAGKQIKISHCTVARPSPPCRAVSKALHLESMSATRKWRKKNPKNKVEMFRIGETPLKSNSSKKHGQRKVGWGHWM